MCNECKTIAFLYWIWKMKSLLLKVHFLFALGSLIESVYFSFTLQNFLKDGIIRSIEVKLQGALSFYRLNSVQEFMNPWILFFMQPSILLSSCIIEFLHLVFLSTAPELYIGHLSLKLLFLQLSTSTYTYRLLFVPKLMPAHHPSFCYSSSCLCFLSTCHSLC